MNTKQFFQEFFKPEQAAKEAKVCVFTIYRWIKARKLTAIRINPSVFLINRKDFREFLKKRKTR